MFAAKSDRTKMEEEPVLNVPETETNPVPTTEADTLEPMDTQEKPIPNEPTTTIADEFDLSDISSRPLTREEIIAEAEAAAFGESA